MTPQETALFKTLLARLETTGSQPKDPDAETLIRQATAAQPDAAYYLAQTLLIHDLSLHSAQNRIAELEKSLAEAQAAPSPPTSFLGGLLDTDRLATPAAQPGNPAPLAPNAGMGGGGFLRAAAVTAAGVAGCALLFEGIQSMFGHLDAAGHLDASGITDGRRIDAANPVGQDYDSGDDFGGSERT